MSPSNSLTLVSSRLLWTLGIIRLALWTGKLLWKDDILLSLFIVCLILFTLFVFVYYKMSLLLLMSNKRAAWHKERINTFRRPLRRKQLKLCVLPGDLPTPHWSFMWTEFWSPWIIRVSVCREKEQSPDGCVRWWRNREERHKSPIHHFKWAINHL